MMMKMMIKIDRMVMLKDGILRKKLLFFWILYKLHDTISFFSSNSRIKV